MAKKKKKPKPLGVNPARERAIQAERAARRTTILTIGGIGVGVVLIAAMYVVGRMEPPEDEFVGARLRSATVKVLAVKPAEGEKKRRIAVQVEDSRIEAPCELREHEGVKVGDTVRIYYRVGLKTKAIKLISWTTKFKQRKQQGEERPKSDAQ